MKENFERPEGKMSDEEIAAREVARAASDYSLIKDGATYSYDKDGKRTLDVTSQQIEEAHKEMEEDMNEKGHRERPLREGGIAGAEVHSFNLNMLNPSGYGNSYDTAYLETHSGNIYKITRAGGEIMLYNPRKNEETRLTRHDLTTVEVGKPYQYALVITSTIKRITVWEEETMYPAEKIKSFDEDDIHNRFAKLLEGK
jgi:hypothetical protein